MNLAGLDLRRMEEGLVVPAPQIRHRKTGKMAIPAIRIGFDRCSARSFSADSRHDV